MDRYPALRLIVRYGALGAPLVALVVAGLALALLWPLSAAVAVGVALVLGAITYLIAKAFVEIVTILTEMLVPR